MLCPYCNQDSSVTNSRLQKRSNSVWRRRKCTKCSSIWSTIEHINLETTHKINTSHNSLEPFSRDKLFVSIKDSLKHRKTSLDDATALTDTVLRQILALNSPIITTHKIKDIIRISLNSFDPIAGAVYSATYN